MTSYIKPTVIESLPFNEEGDAELTTREMLDEAQWFLAKSRFIDGAYSAMNEFEDNWRRQITEYFGGLK